ncbi:GLPGLI family protein [Winogradskyella immobilis]|uniref:GLPGLI family protein n=1 Tax=Winogradskyella immobilis TaxID=2816852 RepID=A0ABS8EQ11_9FLAO|nr:GLPGLI family protein [Winogradskyella immobilis]MCC1485318.1 GLPGLI family protein [Winogradskyella immobilis]MCG0017410.1 GLPGLI family protein [Winogradskyella immobilis]
MTRQYFFLVIGFLSLLSYSQQNDQINFYKINYLKTFTFEHLANQKHNSNYTLNIYDDFNKSIFQKENNESNLVEKNKTKGGNPNVTFTPSGKNIGVVYKDYELQDMIYKYSNKHIMKDSMTIFGWKIIKETKKLLGYNCQKATMNFRGRDYIAWFTSDLPVGGPWKFDGLPGMILEIKSTDDFIKFKASSINSAYLNDNLENPFNAVNKFITWQEYKDRYRKKAIRALSYRPTASSRGFEYSRGGIEIFIDYDDEEYNKIIKNYRKNNH